MFSSTFKYLIIIILIIIINYIGLIFSLDSIDGLSFSENITDGNSIVISSSGFVWPTPGYNTITSNYGYRNAPTSGAGTFHSGIDIGAPTGADIIAVFSGTVTYIGFSGPNGYTITISDGCYTCNYSHISPYFLVYVGQFINQGDLIATVGPKNVYGVPNNPYKDSAGNPTNGATTGPHLHFSLKMNGNSVNPLNYF